MKSSTKRRWIYLTAILLAVCCLLLVIGPKVDTANLQMVISPIEHNSVAEFVIEIPNDCRLENVYLRGNDKVPLEGKLMTLLINDEKFEIDNYGHLVPFEGKVIEGFTNKQLPLDIKKLRNNRKMIVSYENLAPSVKRNDLELVFVISGESETLKNWNNIAKVRRRTVAPAAAVEKTSQPAADAEKKAPEKQPAP